MKIKFNKAIQLFRISGNISIDNGDLKKKLKKIWIELLPLAEKWDYALEKKDQDAKPIKEKYSSKFQALSDKMKKEKEAEYNAKIDEEISNLVSSKAVVDLDESEVDVNLPSFTMDEFEFLADILNPTVISRPFYILVEKK